MKANGRNWRKDLLLHCYAQMGYLGVAINRAIHADNLVELPQAGQHIDEAISLIDNIRRTLVSVKEDLRKL